MTVKEAILTLNANVVVACERAKFDSATVKVIEDAMDIIENALQAQEPRVLTLEEVLSQEWDYVYIETEHRPYSKEIEAYCGTHTIYCSTTVVHKRLTSGDSEYGATWRCWTARPTEEQRKATPWGEPPKEEENADGA